jgi:hypothetical protein
VKTDAEPADGGVAVAIQGEAGTPRASSRQAYSIARFVRGVRMVSRFRKGHDDRTAY